MGSVLSTAWIRIKQDIRSYRTGILLALGFYFLLHYLFGAFCLSILITGFPCPGCGMTRALLYLLRGRILDSLRLNPSALLWAVWACFFAFMRYIKGRKSKVLMWTALAIMMFMAAVYVYRMATLFPNRPPYVYTKDNFFAGNVPGYERIVRRLSG